MVVMTILLVLCIIVTIYAICIAIHAKSFWLGFLGAMPTIICIIGIYSINSEIPTAMDVYRGKTILEITYRDSIPIDSIVVFKE